MKYYIVEPAFKKSLYDTEVFEDGLGNRIVVTTCWRGGSFKVTIPETVYEYKEAGYDVDEIEDVCWPTEDDDYVELDDFYEYEMLETWDGCSEDYEVRIDDDEFRERVEEILYEESMTALFDNEELEDFQPSNSWYEIQGGIRMTECDEQGNILGEEN